MRNVKQVFWASVMLTCGSLLIGSGQAPRAVQAADGKGQPPGPNVTVVNTPANPVPVVGTVQLSGSSGPLAVVDVDNPARHAVQARASFFMDGGFPLSEHEFYTVPAGKRLVIETVTASAGVPVGQRASFAIATWMNGTQFEHRLEASFQGLVLPNSGRDLYVATHEVRLYADPGTTVTGIMRRSGDLQQASGGMTISGYLVDL